MYPYCYRYLRIAHYVDSNVKSNVSTYASEIRHIPDSITDDNLNYHK